MKENFDLALVKILKYEGGFTNHPLDRGGPTNQGITLGNLNQFHKDYDYGDLDEDGDVDIQDIILMDTPEEAAPIYKKYYWDRMQLDRFPSGIDFLMFDFGVNSGPKNAARILQKAINRQGGNLTVDGCCGPQTFNTMCMCSEEQIIRDMLLERDIFYSKIVARDLSQEVFLKGWRNRLASVTKEVREFLV